MLQVRRRLRMRANDLPLLFGSMGLCFSLVKAGLAHEAKNPKSYPPPARLIGVSGRTLHLHCSGKGGPTVILMAGVGAFSTDWAFVQPRVAKLTRVCSYDRAGLAWSDQ